MNKKILIIAAHADDEVLGCGGMIAKSISNGDSVFAIFLTDGISARDFSNKKDIENRKKSANQAHELLGLTDVRYLNYPDNRLDSIDLLDLVKDLEVHIEQIKPNVVYTHHYGDLNVDHQIAFKATMTACRPLPDCSVKEIYSFEIISSTEWSGVVDNYFKPTVYIDITNFIDVKLKAINFYNLEMRDSPHSRSIEHVKSLAKHRGNCVGVDAAEAFIAIRVIK